MYGWTQLPILQQLGKKLSSQQKQVNEEGSGGNSKSGECFIKLLLLHSTPRPSQILQLNWKSLHRVGCWGTWLTSTHLLQSFRSTALVKCSKLCWNIHKRTLVTSGKHLLEEERYMPVFLLREGVYKILPACIKTEVLEVHTLPIFLDFWGPSSAKWIWYIHACRAIAIYRIV